MRGSRVALTSLILLLAMQIPSGAAQRRANVTLFLHEAQDSCSTFMDRGDDNELAKCGTTINAAAGLGATYPALGVKGLALDAPGTARGQVVLESAVSSDIEVTISLIQVGPSGRTIAESTVVSLSGAQVVSEFPFTLELSPRFKAYPLNRVALEIEFRGTWVQGRVGYSEPNSFIKLPVIDT